MSIYGVDNRKKPHSEDHKKKIGDGNRGKKVSNETKEKMRIAKLGKKFSEEHKEKLRIAQRNRKRTPLSKEHKEKISESMEKLILENGKTVAYKGIFTPKNPQKYRGDYTNIVWRSTWECRYMTWLDTHSSVISWSSEEIVIPYKDPLKGHTRRYFVDFYVQIKDTKGTIKSYLIEIKPKYQTVEPEKRSRVTKKYINEVYTWGVNQAKWKAADEFCKDRGWEFKILTEDDLGV